MRRSLLGVVAVASVACAFVGAAPAQASTEPESQHVVLDDSDMLFQVRDVTASSADITWNPGAFHYRDGAHPDSCTVNTYNRRTDATTLTFFGRTIHPHATSVELPITSGDIRTDQVSLTPGETTHLTFSCSIGFTGEGYQGSTVRATAQGTWEQTRDFIVSPDVVPLAPTWDAVQAFGADGVRMALTSHIAGVEGASRGEIRRYLGERLVRTDPVDLSNNSAGFITDRYGFTYSASGLPNGVYSFAMRMGSSVGWGPWSDRSGTVEVTGSGATSPPPTTRGPAGQVLPRVQITRAVVQRGHLTVRWKSSKVAHVRVSVSRYGKRVSTALLGPGARAFRATLKKPGRYTVSVKAIAGRGTYRSTSVVIRR